MSEFKFESSNDKKRVAKVRCSHARYEPETTNLGRFLLGLLSGLRLLPASYLETDLRTVLESLDHTGHVGMLG